MIIVSMIITVDYRFSLILIFENKIKILFLLYFFKLQNIHEFKYGKSLK